MIQFNRTPHAAVTLWLALFTLFTLFTIGCGQNEETSTSSNATSVVAVTDEEQGTEPSSDPGTKDKAPQQPAAPESPPADNEPATLLVEVTGELGLPTAEADWPDGFYLTPEITPGGVALFDYDNDGDLDIYQICHCQPLAMPRAFREPSPNRLFRQTDAGKFEEVDGAAGLADTGYGHGAAIGDIDNDGDLDVYVTNYGPDVFFINNGDGTFTNQTTAAGFKDDKWSSASAFFDYDRDGDLDLMVVHFATFDAGRQCGGAGDTEQDYCGPHLFDGMQDQLFKNNGNGTFTDVSQESGITVAARGWGIIATDVTGDGWPDIYVCNDEEPNQLWVNSGDGTFMDEAVFRGVAFNGFGRPEASMGVTLGDVDGNQTLDLFMTHVTSETNTLYTLDDQELFSDTSSKCGTAAVDLAFTGWGCGFFDIDHDGDLDLAVANGRVATGPVDSNSKHGDFWNRYAEQNFLFLNQGKGKFKNISRQVGSFASRPEVTRGLAFGDLDNDGDVDLVTNDLANRLRIFRNLQNNQSERQSDNHWLQVRAVANGRIDVGAMVTVKAPKRTAVRPVLRSYSYLSSNDPRVHFGLGEEDHVDSITIRWSDGSREEFSTQAVDCDIECTKGNGRPLVDSDSRKLENRPTP